MPRFRSRTIDARISADVRPACLPVQVRVGLRSIAGRVLDSRERRKRQQRHVMRVEGKKRFSLVIVHNVRTNGKRMTEEEEEEDHWKTIGESEGLFWLLCSSVLWGSGR